MRRGTVLYAAYGSNLHPERLRARTPSARLVGSAPVHGWALRFHKRGQDGSAKCDIVAADAVVHVAVYALSAGDKCTLDRIEGVGRGYRLATLSVPDHGTCATYVAERDYIDTTLRPFCWYREWVARGAGYHGFPADYRAAISALATQPDRDRVRYALHWQQIRDCVWAPAAPTPSTTQGSARR